MYQLKSLRQWTRFEKLVSLGPPYAMAICALPTRSQIYPALSLDGALSTSSEVCAQQHPVPARR